MTKRLLVVYLILVVLLAAMVPSCTQPGGGTGTIVVNATLCGEEWSLEGGLNYTLTGPSTINGNTVPATHSGVATGNWNCTYVSGGPAGAFLNSIKPSASQTLSGGGTITFTFDFELNQDAAIHFMTWTSNGAPWDPVNPLEVGTCNVTDVHFLQWVDGCDGYNVTLNETDWLMITAGPANPGPAWFYVVNASCALNKTPDPQYKVFQMPSIDNATAKVGDNITLMPGMIGTLDVHTQWQLVKGTNYTKSINWLGISIAWPGEQTTHNCTLFELVVPPMPKGVQYTFQLFASAHVDLVGHNDTNPVNNDAVSPLPLNLVVIVPP